MILLVTFVYLLSVLLRVQSEIVTPTCSGDGENAKAFSNFNASESPASLLCPGTPWLQLFKKADLHSAVLGSVMLAHDGYKMVSVGFAKGYDFAKWFQVFAPNMKIGPSQWYQALKDVPSAANATMLCGTCEECRIKQNSSTESKEADPVIHFVGIDLNRESISLVQSVVRELKITDSSLNNTITFDFMHGVVGSPFSGKEMTVRKCPAGDDHCKIMDYDKNATLSKEGYEFVPVLNLNEILLNVGVLYQDNHRRLQQQEPQEVRRQQHTPHVSVATRPAHLQQSGQLPHSPAQTDDVLANLRTQQKQQQLLHQQQVQHPVTHPAILANLQPHQHVPNNPQHHQVHPEHAHVQTQSLHTSHASASLPLTRSSHSTMSSLQRAQLASKQIQSGVLTSPAQTSAVEHLRVHTGTVTPGQKPLTAAVHVPKLHAPKPHPGSEVSHPPPPPMLPTTFAPRAEVIDLLHISAGGLEAQALQTCEPAFAARRVRAVTFEFGHNTLWMQASLRRVVKDLSTHRYECYLQGQKGLWPISGTCWNDNYHTRESQGSVLCVLRSDPWLEAIQPLVMVVGGPVLDKGNNSSSVFTNNSSVAI